MKLVPAAETMDAAPEPPAKRILVVDDIPEIGDLFRGIHRRLRSPACAFFSEVNSARALELVRSTPFDLVISDYRMREVDGIEVLRAARECNPSGHRVLMTGYNEIPTTMQRIRAADIDAYIQKPLKAQDILVMIIDMLNENRDAIAAYRAEAREIEVLGGREEDVRAGRHSGSW
ncbi:MAG TPA: response regulator [Candidatus Thermoplasmatota archaeon]|nr:response regulator [Candidatus Thermoplasmatota archaeon]